MSKKLCVACIQTVTTPDVAANQARLEPLIREARAKGADLITLPENANLQISNKQQLFATARHEAEDTTIPLLQRMAKDTGAWILAGSLAIATGEDRLANRGYLFDPKGEIAARYDKIHMFDANLGPNLQYHESANYRPGDKAVVATMPWGKLGLSICYDLRFPHLYRCLAKAGANVIAIPAAFAETTGKMHWHVLLRARAIETGCFIVAPAQCGARDDGRRTYGHSLIVAPSGSIIAEAGDEPGVIVADLDLNLVTEARHALPCLKHDREFEKA
jgi:predicted amidohydrolase